MQKQRPKTLSTQLTELFTEINNTFGRAKELVVKAYNLALQEGYTPQEAKNLLLDNIKVFGKSTIYNSLPEECKDQNQRNRKLGKMVPKLEPVEGRLNEGSEDTTAEHNFNTEGMGVAILDDDNDNVAEEEQDIRKENAFLKQGIEFFRKQNNELRKENEVLRKKLDEYQRIPSNDALVCTIDLLKRENAQLREELGK